MANVPITVSKISAANKVVPGAHGRRPRVTQGDQVQWTNSMPGAKGILLIFENWVQKVFVSPPALVTFVAPGSNVTFTVKNVTATNKKIYTYKVYVVDDDNYAQGGSDPEMEVK